MADHDTEVSGARRAGFQPFTVKGCLLNEAFQSIHMCPSDLSVLTMLDLVTHVPSCNLV